MAVSCFKEEISTQGPIRLETSNAPISATLGPHFRGRLDLDTSNARLRIEDAAQRIVDQKLHKSDGYLVIGDESMFSRLDTSNGSITVKVRLTTLNHGTALRGPKPTTSVCGDTIRSTAARS